MRNGEYRRTQVYIKLAVALGYVDGYADGTFRPNVPITRAEVATLRGRVQGRHVESYNDLLPNMKTWIDNPYNASNPAWYYLAIQEATNSHFYDRKEVESVAPDGKKAMEYSKYENWTEMRDNPEWVLLEKTYSVPEDVQY